MSKLNEAAIEALAIQLLQTQGYTYLQDSDRTSTSQILLTDRLTTALHRINPNLAPELITTARQTLERIQSPELLTNNEIFHRYLTEGIPVTYQKDGIERGDRVWPIDFTRLYFRRSLRVWKIYECELGL